MAKIRIYMKDGTCREFEETSTPGGSYCTKLRLENGFAIVQNANGDETIIPSGDIVEIKKESYRRW